MYPSMSSFRPVSSASRNAPLLDSEIRKVAPSVFAEEAHESRSARYAYIPTSDVLGGLRTQGFEVFSAGQARCRSDDRREHTKHLLRLRHVGDAGRKLAVGDGVVEICLLNSHDGSSSYQMFAGFLRLVCSNGLMVPESTLGSVRIPHSGNVKERVIAGAFEVLDGCTRVIESRDAMQSVALAQAEQDVFARAALTLRYDDETQHVPIEANQLLRPRRVADRDSSLWTTFNVVQENVIRGGLHGLSANRRNRASTRAITGIDQGVRINKALWQLAEEMARLKASH